MSYVEKMGEIFSIGDDLIRRYNSDDFEVVFRFTRFREYEQRDRGYCHCRVTPTLWSYIQSDGTWITCSAYWSDSRFHVGNINKQTVQEIIFSPRWREHQRFVTEELNITECRKTCHPDKDNGFLHKVSEMDDNEFEQTLIQIQGSPRPRRVNFI
jgi:GTP 3',8-cyclase